MAGHVAHISADDLRRWEIAAPPRLSRADTAALRNFYARCRKTFDVFVNDPPAVHLIAFSAATMTIHVSRDPKHLAVARLGSRVPLVDIDATWTRDAAWGLNVTVAAMAHGAKSLHTVTVATHRFRATTQIAEFMRIMGRSCRIAIGAALALHQRFGADA